MEAIIQFLNEMGAVGLDFFWLPVAIWTIAALVIIGGLTVFEKQISTLYNYHARVALLWGLAAGVLGAALLHFLPLNGSTESITSAKFIVIQNPKTVEATATATSINWGNPTLWIGLITALTLLAAIGSLIKLVIDFVQLKLFSATLNTSGQDFKEMLNRRNRHLLLYEHRSVQIIFSNDVSVPCTFGWMQKRIVLPAHFTNDTQKLNMAIRHELVHIKSNDFVVNATVKTIRALFAFHPLVHKLAADIEPYREMNCDQHVLQDADISQQNYARLLFELSPQPVFKTAAAVNMAVDPSTLKKRIQTMKKLPTNTPSLRWSFSLMLACTLALTGLMACSDIEEGGITRSEVEDTQANINNIPTENRPLILVDGEELEKDKLGKIDPNSIKSVEVLKGEAAEKFGEAGKNGVIDITLKENAKAFSDSQTNEKMKNKADENTSEAPIFMAVEDLPEMKGTMAQLQGKAKYPAECKNEGLEGRVTVQFVVDKQGHVQNAEVIRGIGGSCDEEALRVIRQAEFVPGRQRGKRVNVRMSLPIIFKLNSSNTDQPSDNTTANVVGNTLEVQSLQLNDDGTLSGKIYNEKENKPLVGANITIKGTNKGAATNENGKFVINNFDEQNGVIRVSFVGYSTLEVNVN